MVMMVNVDCTRAGDEVDGDEEEVVVGVCVVAGCRERERVAARAEIGVVARCPSRMHGL